MPLPDIEPSLLPPSTRLRRRFDVPGLQARYLEFLEARIQRNPRDLRAHVERVLQCLAMRDPPAAYAALVDLNIALGPQGRTLRDRLLGQAADLLGRRDRERLAACSATGIDATATEAAAPGACLWRPVSGTTRLVHGRGAIGDGNFSALAGAASAGGDNTAACLLLEEALHFDPGNRQLCAQLLALYRKGGRRADFERTRTSLLGRKVALPEQWEETAAWFRGHHG